MAATDDTTARQGQDEQQRDATPAPGNYADALELEALEDSKHLIKFAAEHKAELKQETVLALEQARAANDAGAWNSTVAASFWTAFSALCNCVSPVTITSIYANVPTITRTKWHVRLFNARPIVSLSERTARRYTALLLVLLLISILLGYTVNSVNKTTEHVNATLTAQDVRVKELRGRIREYKSQFPLPPPAKTVTTDRTAGLGKSESADARLFPTEGSAEMLTEVDKMQELGSQIDQAVDSSGEEISALMRFLSPFQERHRKEKAGKESSNKHQDGGALATSINDLQATSQRFYDSQYYVSRTLPWINGIAAFINFAILPALLGTMGACAYIVRMISDQIKTTTFTRTSLIQDTVRVALGALTGVVLGFGGYFVPAGDGGSALSTAAISFLAGYAVEPVFALFDKIAQSFKA